MISVSNWTSNVPSIIVLPLSVSTVNLSTPAAVCIANSLLSALIITLLLISDWPAIVTVPPICAFSESPKPPVTTKVPVVVDVEPVLVVSAKLPAIKGASVPENTSEVLVASGIKVNLPLLSSYPKKPTFAAEPVWYLNSIPLSLLSSEPGAVSPPKVNTGSSTVVVVLFTVVVVPLIVKLPSTVRLLPIVTLFGNPIVIPWPLATVSISLVVPDMVKDWESKSTEPVPLSPAVSKSWAVILVST